MSKQQREKPRSYVSPETNVIEIDARHIAFRDGELWRPALLEEEKRNGVTATCVVYASYADAKKKKGWTPIGSHAVYSAVRFALRRGQENPQRRNLRAFPVLPYTLSPAYVRELVKARMVRLHDYHGAYQF